MLVAKHQHEETPKTEGVQDLLGGLSSWPTYKLPKPPTNLEVYSLGILEKILLLKQI